MIKDWKTPMFELEFEEVRVKDPSARVENLYMVLKLSADEVITFLGNMETEDLVNIVTETLAHNEVATAQVEKTLEVWVKFGGHRMNFTLPELYAFIHAEETIREKLWAIAVAYDWNMDRYEYSDFAQTEERGQKLPSFTIWNTDQDSVTIPFRLLSFTVKEAVAVMHEEDEERKLRERQAYIEEQRLAEEKRLEAVRLYELSELKRLKDKYEK